MKASAKTGTFTTVDEYVQAQPERAQKALQQVRHAIREAVPDADEVIAYNMPTYKLGDASLLNVAAWKEHYALYVASKPIVAAFASDLKNCEIGKGTIRFSFNDPVPEKLIQRIVRFRAQHLG
ncbi:MAG TPA: DUF1801 domain-containing protein [Candidatus Baltobacteraceae bacterium]|jgi:uncharacterized protein YdhG (YjbR/CyaY superfamily)|nr:DUF1801 domain-containing protein [Candidatus Baltobacteraceae bacterium]